MRRRIERGWRCAWLAGALLSAGAEAAAAQEGSVFERLGLDRLQVTALGATAGIVRPSQLHATELYAVHADYGEITRHWRIVFGAAYWQSRYTDVEVRKLAERIRQNLDDPTGDASVRLGPITVSNIALGVDARWTPLPRAFLSPYLGGGIAGHVLNTEGELIRDTFVESSLDYITAGVAGMSGLNMRILDHLSLGVQARYDLLSGVRFGSLRASGTYVFPPSRGGAGS